MAEYFVIGPTGEKFGPANIEVLNQWAQQNRVLPSNYVEDAATGTRMLASQVPGLIFPVVPPMTANYPRAGFSEPYEKVENHLVKAILTTLFCCLPIGIAAIVFASQVDGHARVGNMTAARESARKANMWANIAIGLGLAYIIVMFGIGFLGSVLDHSSSSSSFR